MKVTLYNATSIDGFIATPEGNSDWVHEADTPHFEEEIKRAGVLIVGKTSYEQFKGSVYPMQGVLNVVMTHDEKYAAENTAGDVIATTLDPHAILSMLDAKGFTTAVIVGGGKLNASFLAADVIDEIIIDIHPIVLAKGIKMFESEIGTIKNFTLETVETIQGGLIKLRFQKQR